MCPSKSALKMGACQISYFAAWTRNTRAILTSNQRLNPEVLESRKPCYCQCPTSYIFSKKGTKINRVLKVDKLQGFLILWFHAYIFSHHIGNWILTKMKKIKRKLLPKLLISQTLTFNISATECLIETKFSVLDSADQLRPTTYPIIKGI